MPYSFIFFFVGYNLKDIISKIVNILNERIWLCVFSSALCFALVYLVYRFIGNLDIGRNYYTDYKLISLVTAFIGIFGVISLCSISQKSKGVINQISSATLLIMCLHIPIIQFIQLHIFKVPTQIYLSLISSVMIVAILTYLFAPVEAKFPILVGKANRPTPNTIIK